jgi:Ulp1 family protease
MHGRRKFEMEMILRYLKDEHRHKLKKKLDVSKWKLIGGSRTGVPTQDNNDDCGVFTCSFANFLFEFLSKEENLDKPIDTKRLFKAISAERIPRIRKQLQLDILRGRVFPAITKNPVTRYLKDLSED